MTVRDRVRAWFAPVLLAATAASAAPVELRYGETPAEVLTVHAGDARSALPVVVHFGTPDPALAGVLGLRGYVFVVVPLPGERNAALESAADALAFVARGIIAHGGDPDRLHLAGTGPAAAVAAQLGADVEVLTQRRVLRDAVDAIALRDGRAYVPAVGQETPPTLLLHANDDALARRDAERYAARLRESGGSAEVNAVAAGPRGAEARIVAWLDAASIARVGRFEQLAFEPGGPVPAGLATLVAANGGLLAGDGASARVFRKRSPTDEWRVEHDFGEAFASIPAIAVGDDGRRACVLLRDVHGALASSCLDRVWSLPVATPLVARAGARAPVLLPAASAQGSSGASFAASGGRLVRVEAGTPARVELDGDSPIRAMAWVDGIAYAAIGGNRPAVLRRDEHAPAWRRVASIAAEALVAVPDPAGGGHEVLLAATRSGVERYDPRNGHAHTRELEFAEAFTQALGVGARVRGVGAGGFVALAHPYTHDVVHALALELEHPDRTLRGAHYLVRQLDGSYGYALVRDFLAPRDRAAPSRLVALAPSPFDDARGAWFLGVDASAQPVLMRGTLSRGSAREGIWWDRSAPGHGLALHPAADGWLAMLYSYDAGGEPVWYLAVGEIDAGRFIPDSNGLSRYRIPPGENAPVRDADRSGAIEIRFADARGSVPCAATPREDAIALAVLTLELEGRRIESCIEPIMYGPRGLPSIDTTGVWHAGAADRAYGIALVPQGFDGRTREAALVYYYDTAGEPRWALGSGDVSEGAAAIELSSFTAACLGCEPAPLASTRAGTLSHRMQGFCGRVAGSASVALEYPGPAGGQLARRNAPLERLSRARCY